MNKAREAAEAEVYKWVEAILPNGGMPAKYKTLFGAMDDAAFDAYMKKLASGEEILSIEAPIQSKAKISIENNFAVAKKLGHEFFEKLWLTDPATGTVYLTPHRYLVIDLPLRRQQQMLVEKVSIPENNRHVDEMTGQPSGDSHSSSLTFPELQVLYARGCNATIEELAKFRGGDLKAFQRMNRQAQESGGVSMAAIKEMGSTQVKSTETLYTYLVCMHYSNTLLTKDNT